MISLRLTAARQRALDLMAMPRLTLMNLIQRYLSTVVVLHLPSWCLPLLLQGPRADERPMLNLDVMLAAAVACLSPVLGGLLLVLAWTADILRAAATNYHFMSTSDFVEAARFLDMLHIGSFVSVTLLLCAISLVVCGWWVLKQTRTDRWLAVPLVMSCLLGVGLDVINGSSHLLGRSQDSRRIATNLAGSPAWNVWRGQQRAALDSVPTPMPDAVAFRVMKHWRQNHSGSTSLLVLVESMGLPRSPAVRDWLEEQLYTPRLEARWSMQRTQETFVGSTTGGELRVLCGLRGAYTRLEEAHAVGCLPRSAAAHGGHSVGIHGFGLRMFDRRDWWPKVGLTAFEWPEKASPSLPMNCNRAFPGVCDSAVLDEAVTAAQQPGGFIYALTLDTHLPIDLHSGPPLPDKLRLACESSQTPQTACHLVGQLGRVLQHLEQELSASKAAPLVVVVGDHAPPFAEASNRAAFDDDEVPVLVLTPLEATGQQGAGPRR